MSIGGLIGGMVAGSNPLLKLGITALTGGAGGVLMELAKQVLSQLAQNAIDRLALPEPIKGMMKEAVIDQLGEGIAGSPRTNEGIAEFLAEASGGDLNDAQRMVDEISHMIMMFLESGQSGASEMEGKASKKSEKGAEGAEAGGDSGLENLEGGWMMQLAVALGKAINDKFDEVQLSIAHVNDVNSKAGGTNFFGGASSGAKRAMREGPGATAVMQGHMQEMGFLLSAASTAIKTAGQGATTMASKQ